MATSGAQPGNKNAATTYRPWTDALRKAVLRIAVEKDADGKKQKKLDAMATMCVTKALQGDMAAVHEIANRLEGRPAQQSDDGEGLTITLNFQRTREIPSEFIDGEQEEVVSSDERHYVEKR